MAPNPLKPLIKAMFVMMVVAGAVLFVHVVRLAVIAEQERVAESQRRAKEMRERADREMEENRKAYQLRREQEIAQAKAAAERRAKEEAAQAREAAERREREKAAAEAKNRGIDLTAAFDKKIRQAADGDPNAQFLIGYVYYLGMDRIIGTSDSRLTVFNSQVITLLIGEPLATKPLVSVPTFHRNEDFAVKWFERAARQGHQGAQVYLGMANAGLGNHAQAYAWMLIAEGSPLPDETTLGMPSIGVRNSMKENFRQKLNAEQAAAAEKQAKEFKPAKEAR